ncbi:hypothetical protein Emag_005394 [Eimeria magna]
MWTDVCIVLFLLGVTIQTRAKLFFVSASQDQVESDHFLPISNPLDHAFVRRRSSEDAAAAPTSASMSLSRQRLAKFSVCNTPRVDPELRRMCLLALDHLPALYKRLDVEFEILGRLSPEELLSAVSEGLNVILAEEDRIADLVIEKKLPHGALPVHSLKEALKAKLDALQRLRPKNITTRPGLMGLQIQDGELKRVGDCVNAQVIFFHDLMNAKFKLAKLTPAEVEALVAKVTKTFAGVVLKEADLPAAFELIARQVMNEVAAPARAESLGAALQAMPPFAPVGDDNGLSPLSASNCLILVRGLFPTLRAHMTLHYEMKDPTEEQLQAMADVLLPMLNAHRSRLRSSAQKGFTILAPEEHAILWAYMEQFAREHKLVGRERPLNLWRFPNPAGAANILD